jgi:sphinganine-1-phosphate aldolase
MIHMGEEGYLACAKEIMISAKKIEAGINNIEGLKVLGKPDMSVISFAVDNSTAKGKGLNIFKVGESMGTRHWNLNTLQKPSSIHLCCTYMHRGEVAERFLNDLRAAVDEVYNNPHLFKNGSAAIYGMAESIPDTAIVDDIAKGFIDTLFKV